MDGIRPIASRLTPARSHRPGSRLIVAVLLVAVAFASSALLTACESKVSKEIKLRTAALQSSIGTLADQGDVEAAQVVADIEVLRSQSVFSDSVANALTAMPGAMFLHLDEQGQAQRFERGTDIATLLEFTGEEAKLIQDGVITSDDAADVRRLATDNMSAAAEKAKALKGRRGSGLP
jgi:hypothetical protein